MSDPFQHAEEKLNTSYEFLQALSEYTYPTVISTRSPLIATQKFLDVLRGMRVIVQFSLTTIDDRQAQLIEPHAPQPSAVLRTMKMLANAGIKITARWQPYIPNFSPPADEFIDAVARAGASQVGLEHLKIPTEGAWNPILRRSSAVLEKARQYYTSCGARRDGREFVLPATAKLSTVILARHECHKRGLAFGAADNELQYLSDGDACCSSVDIVGGFDTVYRYTIPFMIKKQISKGNEIRFLDTAIWRPKGSIDRFLNSKSRSDGRTVEHFIRRRWNDLAHPSSPANYYGIAFTGETDGNNLNIYTANESHLKEMGIRNDFQLA